MKNRKSQNEYVRRVNKSLEYISANIDRNLNLDQVAEVSHFSPFHFHRIFHGIVGETVNDFIVRKKMEIAINRLLCNPTWSMTEVAERGGFSSSANFSKAFKLYFGVSPSQIRNPDKLENSKIGKLSSKYGKEFDPKKLYSQFITDTSVFEPEKLEEFLMNVKIENWDEKRIAYLTAPDGYEVNAIFETWDKIINWAKAQGIKDQEKNRFAICHDNPVITPIEKCRYDASVEVSEEVNVAEPFVKSTIPAGKYAVAYYKGDGDKIANFYMELYSHWLPNSGFEPDNYPPVAHYLNDSRQDGFVEMEACIKVKELSNK